MITLMPADFSPGNASCSSRAPPSWRTNKCTPRHTGLERRQDSSHSVRPAAPTSAAAEAASLIKATSPTAKIAHQLTNTLGLRSPLIHGVYKVVHEQLDPRLALRELMSGAAQDDIDPSLFQAQSQSPSSFGPRGRA